MDLSPILTPAKLKLGTTKAGLNGSLTVKGLTTRTVTLEMTGGFDKDGLLAAADALRRMADAL